MTWPCLFCDFNGDPAELKVHSATCECHPLRADVERLTANLRTAEGVIERNEASIARLTLERDAQYEFNAGQIARVAALEAERDEAELILDRTCKYIADKMPLSGAHSVFENIDAAVAERDQLREKLLSYRASNPERHQWRDIKRVVISGRFAPPLTSRPTMTNKQAAETLRRMELASRLMDRAGHAKERGDACQRGADAIEFKEWLFEPHFDGGIVPRIVTLFQDWHMSFAPSPAFRDYCEREWRASRGTIT